MRNTTRTATRLIAYGSTANIKKRNTWDTLNCPVCGGEIHRRGDYEEMRVARGSRIMKKGDSYIQLTENGKVVEK